jgi:ABC-type transporter Mla MlaB component
MLRITIHDSPSEFRLHLEGRLAGPWVREVEQCWQTARSDIRDQTLTVDLRDVNFVSSAGEQLLATMHRHGAKFLAASPMMKSLLAGITGEPEDAEQSGGRLPNGGARHPV